MSGIFLVDSSPSRILWVYSSLAMAIGLFRDGH